MRAPLIAVTGGIASGKTTVAKALAGAGGELIDCDSIGHGVLESESIKRRLIKAFGKEIIESSGTVDRRRLAEIVFSSPHELEKLNRLIKPELKRTITNNVLSLREGAEYIVLDAVLFFKYKFRFKVDLVVATYAPVETRVKRLMRRDGIAEDEAMRRVAIQSDLEEDWKRADYIMNTDKKIDIIIEEAVKLRERFLEEYYGRNKNL